MKIKVEKCIDSDEWSWAVIDDDGHAICDGHRDTHSEAEEAALEYLDDYYNWLNRHDSDEWSWGGHCFNSLRRSGHDDGHAICDDE